jgi:hypothetical protein
VDRRKESLFRHGVTQPGREKLSIPSDPSNVLVFRITIRLRSLQNKGRTREQIRYKSVTVFRAVDLVPGK